MEQIVQAGGRPVREEAGVRLRELGPADLAIAVGIKSGKEGLDGAEGGRRPGEEAGVAQRRHFEGRKPGQGPLGPGPEP